MNVYIVRHGIAEPLASPRAGSDRQRTLTANGRRRTRQAARGLKALGVQPDMIASSPFVRALETAGILLDVLLPDGDVEVCGFLAPGATADDLLSWLPETDCADPMVVGHNPDCADIAAALLGMSRNAILAFGKAAACCISFDAVPGLGDGRLEWLLQPKQLRMLA